MVRDIERVLGERIERRQMPGFDWPVVETAEAPATSGGRRRRPRRRRASRALVGGLTRGTLGGRSRTSGSARSRL